MVGVVLCGGGYKVLSGGGLGPGYKVLRGGGYKVLRGGELGPVWWCV